MNTTPSALPVLVAGGGIGGIAVALALVRQGFAVKVLEQSAQLGDIGAGIQLGPTPLLRSTHWASARLHAYVPCTPMKC